MNKANVPSSKSRVTPSVRSGSSSTGRTAPVIVPSEPAIAAIIAEPKPDEKAKELARSGKRERDEIISNHLMYLIDRGLDDRLYMLSVQLPSDFDHNFHDSVGRTPYTACGGRLDRVLSVMTFLKSSLDFPDTLGRVPLAAFIQMGRRTTAPDIVFYLNRMRRPEAALDLKKRNLLHFYCGFFYADDVRPVERMLDLGVSARAKDLYGKNPVDLAAKRAMPKIVRTFLLRGFLPQRQFVADAAPSTKTMIVTALALERQVLLEIWTLKEIAKIYPDLMDVLMTLVMPQFNFLGRIERVLARMDAYIEFALSKRPPKRVRRSTAGYYGHSIMNISSQ